MIPLSITRYSTAGIVVKAALCQPPSHLAILARLIRCLRPKNKAKVVKVPCSLSNLSISGVSATEFRTR